MTDDPILGVIAEAVWNPDRVSVGKAKFILAALRDAGYDIVPANVATLGRAALGVVEAGFKP